MVKFYVASVGIYIAIIVLDSIQTKNRLKRENINYHFKRTISEIIFGLLKTLIVALLPVLNIILALCMVFNDEKIYKKIKEEYIFNNRLQSEEMEKLDQVSRMKLRNSRKI